MNISLKCSCGAIQGLVEKVSRSRSMRTVCLCDDCQAYAHFLGRPREILDENGGTDILPVAPANLKLTRGLENLRCLRLTPKGILRWYAGCCKTPIANSAPSPRMPYHGVVHTILDLAGGEVTRDEALGPIRARIFGKYGIGHMPSDTLQKFSAGVMAKTIGFLLTARLKRQNRPSPFFDPKSGKPVMDPYTLTPSEREALRPFCGPRAHAAQ